MPHIYRIIDSQNEEGPFGPFTSFEDVFRCVLRHDLSADRFLLETRDCGDDEVELID